MTWLAVYLAFGCGTAFGVWLRQQAEQADQLAAEQERELQSFWDTLEERARQRELNGQVRERLRQQGMRLDMPPEDYAKQLGATLALMEGK